MKKLYPAIEPHRSQQLTCDSVHKVYVEECGNPSGIPVIFVHGGPASGCKPDHRRFFNPKIYRVILFDQRGCGRSIPSGAIDRNTTDDLLTDMEHIREWAGVSKWLVYGGSWGATLGLLYAQKHSNRVLGMVLRGTFLARRRDLQWVIEEGANRIYPEQWDELISPLSASERKDIISAIDKRLWGSDELGQYRIAKLWDSWNAQLALGSGFDANTADEHVSSGLVNQVRIELHYAKHDYFIEDNHILNQCHRLSATIPIALIHGRYDLVCPVESAYLLFQALPSASLRVLPNSGHIAHGEEMIDALVNATDQMAEHLE